MSNHLIVTEKNNLGLLNLNRPKALNALDLEMINGIRESLDRWGNDDNINAVIITGEGENAFCAGGDVKAIYQIGPGNVNQSLEFFKSEYTMNRSIFHFPKPYVAMLHGVSMGGGLGVSMHGSYKIAADNLILAMPETGIGFFTDIGSSYHLSRLPDGVGMYLALTGARISAALAQHLGLVDAVVEANNFDQLKKQLLDGDFSENALDEMKRQVLKFEMHTKLSDHEKAVLDIATSFKKSSVEQIFHALNSSGSEMAEHALTTLMKKSPLSVMVNFELMRRAEDLSLDECLDLDLILVKHFISDPNFYEGIRAVVVDKDQKPKWQPATLAEITPEIVDAFFRK